MTSLRIHAVIIGWEGKNDRARAIAASHPSEMAVEKMRFYLGQLTMAAYYGRTRYSAAVAQPFRVTKRELDFYVSTFGARARSEDPAGSGVAADRLRRGGPNSASATFACLFT